MPKKISNALINIDLGELSKPENTLIEKISDARVDLFAPWQIERVAKAETAAASIEAESEIQINDMQRRAVHRLVEEETQYQKNMEGITAKALPQLNEIADPDSIEDDWIVNFFEKSRIVSDNEIQDLWSRILAGEANAPGTYSKRTVNFLSDLDKAEADLFTQLCGFVWMIGKLELLVFDETAEIYNEHGIDFDSLSHLESIGLVQFGESANFMIEGLPKRLTVVYYDRLLVLKMPKDADNMLTVGKVLLTRIGKELAPISGSQPVDGFVEYVKARWKRYLPKPETQ